MVWPLTQAILSHPNGTKIIDECFDHEGFNPFHRAAQGANMVAIRKFLSWGANHSLKSENGFSPLWLSVLYAVKYKPDLKFHGISSLTSLEIEVSSLTALEILDRGLQNETFDVGCDESRPDMTLYHVAASRGMWKFIAHLLSSKKITGIDVNCSNKHGITPMYLAKFMGGDSCEGYSPWCKVIEVIKSYGGILKYPTLEAEYFLIFNVLFGTNPSTLSLELSDEEITSLREKWGGHECEQYEINNDLVKISADIDKFQHESSKKVEKCARFMEECPAEINRNELPHVAFVLSVLDEKWGINFSFFITRHRFMKFLEFEMEVLKDSLGTATQPRTLQSIVEYTNRKMDRVRIYREYKKKLDLFLEDLYEVKSLLRLNGTLPRYLEKVYFALLSLDSMLKCDWRAVASIYVQHSFQFHNSIIFYEFYRKSVTAPVVSVFALGRVLNFSFQSSEESRQLMLKLSSSKPVKEFTYLRILRFRKPPF